MDFTFTPEQDEAAELAARILKDRATNDRMIQILREEVGPGPICQSSARPSSAQDSQTTL